jgi:hypothetical protein
VIALAVRLLAPYLPGHAALIASVVFVVLLLLVAVCTAVKDGQVPLDEGLTYAERQRLRAEGAAIVLGIDEGE